MILPLCGTRTQYEIARAKTILHLHFWQWRPTNHSEALHMKPAKIKKAARSQIKKKKKNSYKMKDEKEEEKEQKKKNSYNMKKKKNSDKKRPQTKNVSVNHWLCTSIIILYQLHVLNCICQITSFVKSQHFVVSFVQLHISLRRKENISWLSLLTCETSMIAEYIQHLHFNRMFPKKKGKKEWKKGQMDRGEKRIKG